MRSPKSEVRSAMAKRDSRGGSVGGRGIRTEEIGEGGGHGESSPLTPALSMNLPAGTGRDAFHCVPNCKPEDGDAVERVPTGFRGSRREISFRGILSPLRGERARGSFLGCNASLAACGCARQLDMNASARRETADSHQSPVASPSPLNGERAGVRGEAVGTGVPFARAIRAPNRLIEVWRLPSQNAARPTLACIQVRRFTRLLIGRVIATVFSLSPAPAGSARLVPPRRVRGEWFRREIHRAAPSFQARH